MSDQVFTLSDQRMATFHGKMQLLISGSLGDLQTLTLNTVFPAFPKKGTQQAFTLLINVTPGNVQVLQDPAPVFRIFPRRPQYDYDTGEVLQQAGEVVTGFEDLRLLTTREAASTVVAVLMVDFEGTELIEEAEYVGQFELSVEGSEGLEHRLRVDCPFVLQPETGI
jgi:hypothetical protein